jgi:tRNA nucleotidyltransferase/poly(A) polymerase
VTDGTEPTPDRPEPAAETPALRRLLAGVHALGIPDTWTVGGVERDRLMGRPAQDVDLMACGVTADELLALCRAAGHRAQPLEVADRLVGVRLRAPFTPPEGVEIALARTEVSTGEGHAEFEIVPVPVPEHLRDVPPAGRAGDPALREAAVADLSRRDFTCNAVARNTRTGELLDPFGGAEDIAAGIVRAISPDSFRDDPLRAFRMVARMARDDFRPDPETVRLVREAAATMRIQGVPGPDGLVPPEPSRTVETVVGADGTPRRVVRRGHRTNLTQDRIHDELVKALSGDHAAPALREAVAWGLLARVLPEFAPTVGLEQAAAHHELTVADHGLQAVAAADRERASWLVKLVMLMHDTGKALVAADGASFPGHAAASAEQARVWADRLRLSREHQGDVVHLIRHHGFQEAKGFGARTPADQDRDARRFLARHGVRRALLLGDVRVFDRAARTAVLPAPGDPVLADPEAFRRALRRNRDAPTTLRDLRLGGDDLRELGLPPGPEHGRILRALLDVVVDDPSANDPGVLRALTTEHVRSAGDAAGAAPRQGAPG